MKRISQTLNELINSLSKVETDWKDEHIFEVETIFNIITQNNESIETLLTNLLNTNFNAAKTLIRTFLYKSKDEFDLELKEALGANGIKCYQKDPQAFVKYLINIDIESAILSLTTRQFTWQDILLERLRSGRGSAIKGQKRGRGFEDKIEEIIKLVFGIKSYDARCRFVGVIPESTEKADFAIPSREHPHILIEAKAYGATGSKQTDIIGDVSRIVKEKEGIHTFCLLQMGLPGKAD